MKVIAWSLGVLALIGACAAPAQTSAPASADDQAVNDLVLANHILVHQQVLDGWGHVSVRSASHPEHFYLARSMPPALVTRADILEIDIKTCEPVSPGPRTYIERFIHCGIYAARRDVGAIVHSHSPVLVPYGVTHTPIMPLYHVSAFLGAGTAFFDIRESAGDGSDMLVKNAQLGTSLATALGDKPLALMRGHGAVTVGATLPQAVYRAVYTNIAADMQLTARSLGTPKALSPKEAEVAATSVDQQLGRVWDLWVHEEAAAK